MPKKLIISHMRNGEKIYKLSKIVYSDNLREIDTIEIKNSFTKPQLQELLENVSDSKLKITFKDHWIEMKKDSNILNSRQIAKLKQKYSNRIKGIIKTLRFHRPIKKCMPVHACFVLLNIHICYYQQNLSISCCMVWSSMFIFFIEFNHLFIN